MSFNCIYGTVEPHGISKREKQIILAVLAGNTNKKIAENFSISEITVKSHITNIYNKLAVDNRIQLLELLKRYNITP